MSAPQLGPFCQSCSMPMSKPEDFGTTADGHRQNDYCAYCYRAGAFITPEMTMPQMIDFCVGVMARQGIMPEEQARAMLTEVVPTLKRWRECELPVLQVAGGRGLPSGDSEC